VRASRPGPAGAAKDGGPIRPAVETAAFTCETARGGWAQPPPGGLANEARNVQLPGVSHGRPAPVRRTRPRTVAQHGQQLKTAAFTCETACGGSSQPPLGGLANEARNAERGVKDERRRVGVRRPEGWCGPTRPAVENCGPHLRNRRGRLGAAPARGLGKRSLQRGARSEGREARGEGETAGGVVWPQHGRQLKTAAFTCETAGGRLDAAPTRGLGKRSPQRPVAGRFARASRPGPADAAKDGGPGTAGS